MTWIERKRTIGGSNSRMLGPFSQLMIILFIGLLLIPVAPQVAGVDEDNDGVEDDLEATLAERFAPILVFEGEETFYPVSIDYHLNNSNLNQSRAGDDLVDADPTVEEIGNYTDPDDKYYLDNRLGNTSNDGIELDYQEQLKSLNYTVYVRVTEDNYESLDYIVIQYWFFYAYNKGPLNTHEGDWEMIQIILDPGQKPREAMYSQHTEGERASWSLVMKDDDHPKVYVARGSHANYFRAYQGKLSMANDDVGEDGKTLEPSDYDMIMLGEKGKGNHTADQDWLDYAGRWGEYGTDQDELRGKRGSYGPVYREEGSMWDTPVTWGKDMRSVNENIFRLNWFFTNFFTIFLISALVGLVVKVLRIKHRHKDTGFGKRIFSILYIDGLNLKSIGNLLTIIGICLAVYSLFHPWYSVSVDIDSGDFQTNGLVEVISVDGTEGVQVNTLESGSGMIQVFSFPLPFSVIIGLGLFFLILSTIGVRKSAYLGSRYFWAGIKLALPIVIILIFVSQSAALIGMAPVELDAETEDLVDTVSESPWDGDETAQVGEYGTARVVWGLEEGGWYLLYAAVFLFAGGSLEIFAKKDLFPIRPGKPKPGDSVDDIRRKIELLEREMSNKKDDRDTLALDKKLEEDWKKENPSRKDQKQEKKELEKKELEEKKNVEDKKELEAKMLEEMKKHG